MTTGPQVGSEGQQLGVTLDAQLAHGGVLLRADGLPAALQLRGNLGLAEALGDHAQHLGFAFGQTRLARRRLGGQLTLDIGR
ncbi:hypothetical protein G6F46_014961 [Rhizopus delemar]|nr:hypothetical protein G6F46_014961 [Rhizopus delemar]